MVMDAWGSQTCFIFVAVCSILLVVVIRPSTVPGVRVRADAPPEYVPMPDSLQSAGGMSPLDPRVDVEIDVSHDPVTESDSDTHPDLPLDDEQAEVAASSQEPEQAV